MPPPLTSAQIRAARALIRWSAQDLARHSTVSVTTIRRAELMPSATALTRPNDQVIRRTLKERRLTMAPRACGTAAPAESKISSRAPWRFFGHLSRG